MKLFYLLVGCTPAGRHTEQHDVFFGIGEKLADLKPLLKAFWPEAKGKLHIDVWREVNKVGDYQLSVLPRTDAAPVSSQPGLYFINLGGYLENQFEEFHYKLLLTAHSLPEAARAAKQTSFYLEYNQSAAGKSHIDNKYGLDIDDLYDVKEILPATQKELFTLQLTPASHTLPEDPLHIGYLKLSEVR